MEIKKPDFNGVAKAGKNAADFFGKAKNAVVNAIDQNDDGKLGIDDLSMIKDSVKTAVKDSSDKWNEKQAQAKREKELKELQPFFADDIEAPDFSLPKLIRIAEKDERHSKSSLCENAIGHTFSNDDIRVITIYPNKIDLFALRFYPSMEEGLYYVDPYDRDFYISLEEYFNYLKVARISELQKIAQDLGATHFKVIFKEQRKSSASNELKANGDIKLPGKQGIKAGLDQRSSEEEFSRVEIGAEMECLGHEPVEPKLFYFRKDPQIQNLVALRMSNNQLKHQRYTFNLISSSGIKEKDAWKIDAAIKGMKLDGNATVSSEVENEKRRIFEYEIDF